jgi:hypothetical protein
MRIHVGDKLRVPGAFGFYHYGIYIGAWGGHPHCVIHNAKLKEVELTTLEAFADGRPVELAERVARNRWEAAHIVERAFSLLGKNYDLLGFNCEHAANLALHGEAVSLAVRGLFAVGAIVALVAAARR